MVKTKLSYPQNCTIGGLIVRKWSKCKFWILKFFLSQIISDYVYFYMVYLGFAMGTPGSL